MISEIITTDDDLKEIYNSFEKNYEGYIQMSDKIIEHIFVEPKKLPKWEDLHNGINYILEIALYEPVSKKSILIRQINDNWAKVEKVLNENDFKNSDIFHTIKGNLKAKIVQIWDEVEDEFCLGLKTLVPKTLLFAGFEGEKL